MPNYHQKNRGVCPVMVGFKHTGQPTLIRCKRWSCPYCSKRLARLWAIRTFKHLEKLPNDIQINHKSSCAVFITFTLPSQYRDAQKGYRALPALWDTFRKRMARVYGSSWCYIAFVEGQRKSRGGMPHFHIISNKPLPITPSKTGYTSKHKIHNFAMLFGFGYMADQQLVNDKKASWYVSKYASKQDVSIPKGTHRVRSSRNWYREPKSERKPLIVQARNEDFAHFIDRVSSETGVDHETLGKAWVDAKRELMIAQGKLDESADNV